MRKKVYLEKQKFTTNTYMKEAIDYDIIIVKEEDVFVTIKHYKKMTKPVVFDNKTYIGEGYYLVEITPLNENYNIRFYFDSKKEYINCYIDITRENGVEYKTPYYIDLYLDILYNLENHTYYLVDEEELEEAYQAKKISKKDYQFAYKIGNKLLKELENGWDPKEEWKPEKYLMNKESL